MKRKPTFAPYIGSISGLYPEEDPIGDLAYELRSLLRKCRVDRETRKAHVALVNQANALDMDADEGLFDGKTDIIASLVTALSRYAPPYTYFGKLNGEYGFWPSFDDAVADGELQKYAVDQVHQKSMALAGEDVLLVNDHGNVECGRFDKRGRFHSYWSAV